MSVCTQERTEVMYSLALHRHQHATAWILAHSRQNVVCQNPVLCLPGCPILCTPRKLGQHTHGVTDGMEDDTLDSLWAVRPALHPSQQAIQRPDHAAAPACSRSEVGKAPGSRGHRDEHNIRRGDDRLKR